MSQLLVRGLDEETVRRLKQQADENGRSLQAEVKKILERAAQTSPAEFRRRIAEFHKRFEGRTFSDSAELIREDRDR